MALIKSEMTDYGVEASYWKIDMVSIGRVDGVGSVSMKLYKDRRQSKLHPKKFFKDKVYYIDNDMFSNIFEGMTIDLYSMIYEHIKATDEYFKDAISDNEEVIK